MTDVTKADPNRRQFLGLLGTGMAAGVGLSGTAGAQETPIVSMENNYFDPIGLFIESGTTVRFEIEAGSHSATAYEDRISAAADAFDSGVISAGEFEYTFDVPGTYDYYCIPHQSIGMVGRIVVGEPGGPAEASPIPDGDVPESETIIEQGIIPIGEFEEAGDDHGGGMLEPGPGMMNGGGLGRMMLMPLGFITVVLGLVGGTIYWASRRGTSRDSSGVDTCQKESTEGERSEEEYKERKRQDDV